MTKPTIFLDMDGVCCDFNKASLQVFNRMDLYDSWSHNYSVSDSLGITDADFWKEISKYQENFWVDMEEYPWFKDLWDRLNSIGDVYFCTAPTLDPVCVKGKLQWIQNRLGFNFRKYIFIKDKYLLAKKDNFLVDDYTEQFNNFNSHGGNGILFPQMWNDSRDHLEDRVGHVINSIALNKNYIK